jgi:Zn-dependent protease/CBS domain-containing protein
VRTLLKPGSIFGIEIQLHVSWIITALLLVFSLASHLHSVNPAWSTSMAWASAIITGAGFFASILMHELSHTAVARLLGLRVRTITLFALGGMTKIDKLTANAKSESWIGIIGLITNATIGFGCLAIAWLGGWSLIAEPITPLQSVIVWLGYLNIGLAIINLIPAFPMDGGRIWRSSMWRITGDKSRATRQTIFVGMFFAAIFVVSGIFLIIKGEAFGGLWLIFIGWFLDKVARASVSQKDVIDRLCGVCVRDVMTRNCPVVDGNINLQTFVEDHLKGIEESCFMIMQRGELTGLISFQEVITVGHRRWPYTVIYDVMNKIDRLQKVNPESPIIEALGLLGHSQVNQLAVISNDKLVGIISRDQIMCLLMTRAEL